MRAGRYPAETWWLDKTKLCLALGRGKPHRQLVGKRTNKKMEEKDNEGD